MGTLTQTLLLRLGNGRLSTRKMALSEESLQIETIFLEGTAIICKSYSEAPKLAHL
jgi:hypothetical protein